MKPYPQYVRVMPDWDALEEVGLTGGPLEWKADLLYVCLGRPKPEGETAHSDFRSEREILTYPEGKPIRGFSNV